MEWECKICDNKTDVRIEIQRVDYPICESCSKIIFFSVAKSVALNKTIFDIASKKERKPIEKHPEIAAEVLTYLYKELLKERGEFTPDKIPQAYLDFISSRINEGHTKDELKAVAYLKYKEWGNTEKQIYVRADTLFRPTNFKRYLAEVEVKKPNWKVVSTREQKAIIKELNSYGIRGATDETDALAKELMATGYNRKDFLNLYLKEKI